MNILQKIFTNHYEEMKYILHPRPSVLENVDKMINYGDPSYGGAMYGCPTVRNLSFFPSVARAAFALPVETCIPLIALLLCPSKLFTVNIATVFLQSRRNLDLSF